MTNTSNSETQIEVKSEKKIGVFHYLVSFLSFVPLLGIPVGILCIIYGTIKRKSKGFILTGIGAAGIIFNICLYGSIFYGMMQSTGPFARMQTKFLIDKTLPDIIKTIEYYKLQNGHYPSNLENVGSDIKAQIKLQKVGRSSLGEIYYELAADTNTYYLLVTGPDIKPFTADDILPNISEQEMQKIGYRAKPLETNSFYVMKECAEGKKECPQFQDRNNKNYFLDSSTKQVLEAGKARIDLDEHLKSSIYLELASGSIAMFSSYTEASLHKKIALVFNNQILFIGIVSAPITNGHLVIDLGNDGTYSDAVKLCKSLSKWCEYENESSVFFKMKVSKLKDAIISPFRSEKSVLDH